MKGEQASSSNSETGASDSTAGSVSTGDDMPALAIDLFDHVESLIRLGENRARIIAAGNGALLVGYASFGLDRTLVAGDSSFSASYPTAVAACAMVAAIISLLPQPVSTVFPKIFRFVPLLRREPTSYYFGDIADRKKDVFIREFVSRKRSEHVEPILEAVHMRAQKARQKFTFLMFATILTPLQFLPAIAKILPESWYL